MKTAATADHYREPARYIAWIAGGDAPSSTACRAEGVTTNGATLRNFGGPVPDEFTLYFNRRGDAKMRCRVTSRTESSCDVEFVTSLAIYG